MKLKSIIAYHMAVGHRVAAAMVCAALCAVGFAAFAKGNAGVQLWKGGPFFAECNVGAESPGDYGIYTNFNDAAQATTDLMGGSWRPMTMAELDALRKNCDGVWTTQNERNGYRFKGKGSYSSKSIFLPAAGKLNYDGGIYWNPDQYGYYWISDDGRAANLFFSKDGVKVEHPGNDFGMTIRAVCTPVTYLDWDATNKKMTNAVCTAYEVVAADTAEFAAGKTYVAQGAVTNTTGAITVKGTDANPTRLVLCDGAEFVAPEGIVVNEGFAFVVCGQKGGTGKLIASGGSVTAAGIGGNDNDGDCGTVTINGGMVFAEGGGLFAGASGIGGGYHGNGGTVAINGGVVTAIAGSGLALSGVGIGGCGSGDAGTVRFGAEFTVVTGETADVTAPIAQEDYEVDHSAKYVCIEANIATDPCALTVPKVSHATAVVTKNGRVVSDLTKIQKGSEVVVTWTAEEGYRITAGAIETILMTGNKTAKKPTVDVKKWSTTLEPWFDYIVAMDPIATNGVKLTGGNTCAAGTVLSLSATAPKKASGATNEWVFAGWHSEMDPDCKLDNGTQDWRLASSYKFTSKAEDVTLYARFVPKSLDGSVRIVCEKGYDFTANVQTSVFVQVISYSKPTVTATSLPKGMKWDANILAFTGKPTVPGDVKTCVIKAYNATTGSKAAVTEPVVLHVLDARSPNLPMLKYDEGYVFIPGDTDLEPVLGSQLLNELGLGGWTVSGLPAGMKWDSKNKKITGAATKQLTSYTVKFTNATNKNDIATVAFMTTEFPETKLEPWFDYQSLDPVKDAIATNGVKLTGGKACAAGTVLKLSATAPKAVKARGDEWVFAGWYSEKAGDGALHNETQDWRLASGYKFTSLTNDVTIFARFVPKSEEAQYVKVDCFPDGDNYKTGEELSSPIAVEAAAYTLPTLKVSGLPSGLKFAANKGNSGKGEISGKPTKSGVYMATVTVTTAGKATAATSLKFIVRKDGELKVDVDYDALLGKVTGAGIYAKGKKAALKATANKGYVFGGWYEDKTNLLSQATSYSYLVGTNDVTLSAEFLATADDWATVSCATTTVEYATGVQIDAIKVTAKGGSLPTVKVTGLPSGLKFDAKKSEISGKPKKSGVYAALVKVTTAGKATATATLKFIVRKGGEYVVDVDYDAAQGKVTGMGVYAAGKKVTLKATANKGWVFTGWWEGDELKSQAASYVIDKMPTNDVTMGTSFITADEDKANIVANVNGLEFSSEVLTQATNVSCGVYLEWPVTSGALTMPTTVKVSGLPSGLKFKDGVISGAPTAASKTDKKGKVTPSKVKVAVTSAGKSKMDFVIELTVDPLPVWAVGTFDGYHMEFGATNGTFTATVDKTGKVSGKTAGGIASTTFSAASFGKVFTLDGTNLVYAVDVTVSYKDPETKKTVKAVDTLYLMEDLGTGLGVIGGGDTNGCGCVGIQRAWDRKDLEFPAFDTKALKDPLVLENGITLKFGAKGKVTVGGKVKGDNGDLVAVSGSTYAMPVAWTDEANLLAQVYVYVAPKTNLKTGVSEVYEVLLTVGESGKIDKVSIAPQIVD